MSHLTKTKPAPLPPTSEPTVEDYAAKRKRQKVINQVATRYFRLLDDTSELTSQEAAQMLAGLRHLARLANGER